MKTKAHYERSNAKTKKYLAQVKQYVKDNPKVYTDKKESTGLFLANSNFMFLPLMF